MIKELFKSKRREAMNVALGISIMVLFLMVIGIPGARRISQPRMGYVHTDAGVYLAWPWGPTKNANRVELMRQLPEESWELIASMQSGRFSGLGAPPQSGKWWNFTDPSVPEEVRSATYQLQGYEGNALVFVSKPLEVIEILPTDSPEISSKHLEIAGAELKQIQKKLAGFSQRLTKKGVERKQIEAIKTKVLALLKKPVLRQMTAHDASIQWAVNKVRTTLRKSRLKPKAFGSDLRRLVSQIKRLNPPAHEQFFIPAISSDGTCIVQGEVQDECGICGGSGPSLCPDGSSSCGDCPQESPADISVGTEVIEPPVSNEPTKEEGCPGATVDKGCGCGLPGPSGCDNQCGSTAEVDCAGKCGGSAVVDCAGVCGGPAVDLGCGCGEAGPSGCDLECGSTKEADCAGICGGDATVDCAGVCQGESTIDCAGECGGSAEIDCAGVCGGSATDLGCGCGMPGPIFGNCFILE